MNIPDVAVPVIRRACARYAAVMFYTSGEIPMRDAQRTALLNFVRSGRGFLGVQSGDGHILR
jgi:hypothetical protein